MSKFNELMERLCFDKIPVLKIKDVCCIAKGTQLNKEKLFDEGQYPVINGGINPSGFWNEYNFDEKSITISQGGTSAGYVNWQANKFWAGAHCYVIVNPDKRVNYRYIFHILKMYQNKLMKSQVGATIPSISAKQIGELEILVPSLDVQCEIVHILDSFTKLTAELTAELTARKQQYEYYMNNVFEQLNCRCVALNDLCDIKIGKAITKNDATNGGKYPIISGGTSPMGYYNFFNREENTVTISRVGTAGHVMFQEKKYYLNDSGFSVIPFEKNKNKILSKYLYFALKHRENDIKSMRSKGGVPRVNAKKVGSIVIPFPSIEDQKRIVMLLESFENYVTDIKEGIPAEIIARQKQYEYYRDKLLAFKRSEEN